jgi:hypothetical protein
MARQPPALLASPRQPLAVHRKGGHPTLGAGRGVQYSGAKTYHAMSTSKPANRSIAARSCFTLTHLTTIARECPCTPPPPVHGA